MFELVCSELIVQQTSVFPARYSERPNSTRYLLFYNENFISSFLWVCLWQAEMVCVCVCVCVCVVMPSNHLILCRPLLLLPSVFPSISVFSKESVLCIRWPKYWSFSFSISPSNEYSVMISFRSDWLDLLAVQGTLKSLLQHHSSKASILQHSAFCVVQLSHPYMTTGKTIILIIQNLVGKVMSLLFNTMFLPLLLSVSVLVLQTCLLPCSQYFLLGLWISPLLLPLLLLPTLLLLRK